MSENSRTVSLTVSEKRSIAEVITTRVNGRTESNMVRAKRSSLMVDITKVIGLMAAEKDSEKILHRMALFMRASTAMAIVMEMETSSTLMPLITLVNGKMIKDTVKARIRLLPEPFMMELTNRVRDLASVNTLGLQEWFTLVSTKTA
jgi:hypothetical protein